MHITVRQIQQADVGRDRPTRLARPNSQAQTGTGKGKYSFFMFSGPRAGLATLPANDPYAAICDDHVFSVAGSIDFVLFVVPDQPLKENYCWLAFSSVQTLYKYPVHYELTYQVSTRGRIQ